MKMFRKKKGPTKEELFALLLDKILNERAKEIWERIKDK